MKNKLSKIVKEYIIESEGEASINTSFPRFMQIALSGLKEINSDVNGVEKEITLTVRDNLTAALPCDYVNYIAIGFCQDGRLTSMALNNNLCDTNIQELICSCENETGASTTVNEGDYLVSYNLPNTHLNKDGQFIGKMYGANNYNSNGMYKIINSDYIVFKGVAAGSEVKLRYLASAEKVDGEYLVHDYDVEALKAWIYWKKIQRRKNYPMAEKQVARLEYYNQKRLARNRHRELNIQEIVYAFRGGYKSSPKI